MTAIHIYGLSEKEVTYIANSIAQTVEELEFYRISNKIISINSIGGISDKIILILLSIINALGFTNIFFEITYGKNAYVKTEGDAKELTKYLVTIGKRLMRNISVAVTKLDEPVGKCFENLIEMKEVYDALSGSMITDVEDMILDFGSSILSISTGKKVIEVIKNIIPVMSSQDGYINEIDVNEIRMVARYIDAIWT